MAKEPSNRKKGRGGARLGSGRPRNAEPKTPRKVYLNAREWRVVQRIMDEHGEFLGEAVSRILAFYEKNL
jgi:hypothetical protein